MENSEGEQMALWRFSPAFGGLESEEARIYGAYFPFTPSDAAVVEQVEFASVRSRAM